jgi:hypothetical protein
MIQRLRGAPDRGVHNGIVVINRRSGPWGNGLVDADTLNRPGGQKPQSFS